MAGTYIIKTHLIVLKHVLEIIEFETETDNLLVWIEKEF